MKLNFRNETNIFSTSRGWGYAKFQLEKINWLDWIIWNKIKQTTISVDNQRLTGQPAKLDRPSEARPWDASDLNQHGYNLAGQARITAGIQTDLLKGIISSANLRTRRCLLSSVTNNKINLYPERASRMSLS